MSWRSIFPAILALTVLSGCAKTPVDDILVRTTLGEFMVTLNPEAAPNTVENFLRYVDEGFYDGSDGLPATTFHRVVADFVVQGGGMRTDGKLKLPHDSIAHKGPNGLMNLRGTVAMARKDEPDSGTCQFFVNHVDNSSLDYVSAAAPGYLVFGEVTSGMETIDAIAASPTGSDEIPLTQIVIEEVRRVSR